jgi:ribosomal protein L32
MAVPKKRTSKTRRNQRRSHDAVAAPELQAVGGTLAPRRLHKAVTLGLTKFIKRGR